MISKEYGKFTFICDVCGAGTDTEFDTFQEAVDRRKEIGWMSHRGKDGEWADICPECQITERELTNEK